MTPFSRTCRMLRAEQRRWSAGMLVAGVLLVTWASWLCFARVSVYAVSSSARLETDRAIYPVDATSTGRVTHISALTLDLHVTAGDVLVELDDSSERLALAELEAKASGLSRELAATRAQVTAESSALNTLRAEAEAARGAQRIAIDSAHRSADVSDREADRLQRLNAAGVATEAAVAQASDVASREHAVELTAQSQLEKLGLGYATDANDRRTRISAIERDAAKLEAEQQVVGASLARLRHELSLRRLLAPATGRIAELGTIRTGMLLQQGERIATLVADGEFRVLAQLAPADVFGHVRPGQTARVRFSGFAWTEYGEALAGVSEVAREVRDERAQVRLQLTEPTRRIPLQHGLPAEVRIEIERVSPLQLLLRAAGELTAERQPAAPALEGG